MSQSAARTIDELTVSGRVVAAARRAWETSGDLVQVASTPINGHAHMASIAAEHARRLEFVVDADDPDVWDVLTGMEPAEAWSLCALVPLPLLGVAHERLRRNDYELQGWWVLGDQVCFGGVEIA